MIDWITQNWVLIIGAIVLINELLTLIDKLLPESVTIDNHIADYLAKLLKMVGQKKTEK